MGLTTRDLLGCGRSSRVAPTFTSTVHEHRPHCPARGLGRRQPCAARCEDGRMKAAPADGPLDRMWSRGRTSLRARVARLRSKSFAIAQCALAAGIAWFIAADVLGHPTPFFAPIAAVVSLGTSYGQRLRRVAEVTVGVAVGVLLGDLLVFWLGSGCVAGVAGRGPGHVAGVPARRRSAARHPGGRAVDRHHHAHRRPGRRVHALDRRPDRRLRRAGRGDRRARGARCAGPASRRPRCCARSRRCCGRPPT